MTGQLSSPFPEQSRMGLGTFSIHLCLYKAPFPATSLPAWYCFVQHLKRARTGSMGTLGLQPRFLGKVWIMAYSSKSMEFGHMWGLQHTRGSRQSPSCPYGSAAPGMGKAEKTLSMSIGEEPAAMPNFCLLWRSFLIKNIYIGSNHIHKSLVRGYTQNLSSYLCCSASPLKWQNYSEVIKCFEGCSIWVTIDCKAAPLSRFHQRLQCSKHNCCATCIYLRSLLSGDSFLRRQCCLQKNNNWLKYWFGAVLIKKKGNLLLQIIRCISLKLLWTWSTWSITYIINMILSSLYPNEEEASSRDKMLVLEIWAANQVNTTWCKVSNQWCRCFHLWLVVRLFYLWFQWNEAVSTSAWDNWPFNSFTMVEVVVIFQCSNL